MEKSRLFPILLATAVCSYFTYSVAQHSKNKQLQLLHEKREAIKEGMAPTPTLQLAFARGEWAVKELYGNDVFESQKPYAVQLKDDVWSIDGTRNNEGKASHIEICKETGKILKFSN